MAAAQKLRLGVNIDHVATIRNARGGGLPDHVRAAELAARAGADGITAHLREDQRHITDKDIEGLGGVRGCAFCGVLGHRITECPKLEKDAKRISGNKRDSLAKKTGATGDW